MRFIATAVAIIWAATLISSESRAGIITIASQGNSNLVNFASESGSFSSLLSSGWGAKQQIAWSPTGSLYGATATTIQVFDPPTGNITSIIDSSGAGNPLNGVGSFVFGPDGMLWVASANNGNLIRYNPNGQLLGVVANNWEGKRHLLWASGYLYGATAVSISKFDPSDNNSFSIIDDSSGSNNPLSGVGAMSFGPDGYLWVASASNGNLIRYYTATSNNVVSIAENAWSARKQILWGQDGYLYATSGSDILKYDRISHNSFTLIDNSSGPISGVGAFAYLPEPSGLALAIAGAAFTVRRRARRQVCGLGDDLTAVLKTEVGEVMPETRTFPSTLGGFHETFRLGRGL